MITVSDIYNTKPKFWRLLPPLNCRSCNRREIFQSEFLSELDPSGHKINDPSYYKNIFKTIERKDGAGNTILDEEGNPQKITVEIPIERVSIPMQQIILKKHVTFICGNKIKFIDLNLQPSEKERMLSASFRQGWETNNMGTAIYKFVESVEATGDGAFCSFMKDGRASFKVFSALNGDELHPIYDMEGNLKLFGRSFFAYDYTARDNSLYMEVWDNEFFYRFKLDTDGTYDGEYKWNDKDSFRSDFVSESESAEWILEKREKHGYDRIPIEYLKRDSGACWSAVQDLIDKLEMALSQLFENNKSYAFRIMVIKGAGGGIQIQGDLTGQARAIVFDDQDSSAEFMDKADASSSFELQLKETLKFILMGSFTVLPPEIKGGDMPGVTVKILYSPAIEQAINDINFYNETVDGIVDLFKQGYGIEQKNITGYKNLKIRGDMNVYVPQNDTEVINNINQSLLNGSLSEETALQENPLSAPDEMDRKRREKEEDIEDERKEIINNGMNDYNLAKQNNPNVS